MMDDQFEEDLETIHSFIEPHARWCWVRYPKRTDQPCDCGVSKAYEALRRIEMRLRKTWSMSDLGVYSGAEERGVRG